MKCYWGHTTDTSRMRTCTDGKNPVCPQCCHNHCFKDYAGMYTACAQRGWPVWPPQAAGLSGPRTAEAACYWKHTTNKTMMRVCTDGSNPVCPECCHRHCPTQFPQMYQECASRNWPVWPPNAVGMAAPRVPYGSAPAGYGAPTPTSFPPQVKCYWGHTTDRSRMKTCTDGSNPVCPECCHRHCINEFASMYNSCGNAGWPVWPPQYASATHQVYGAGPQAAYQGAQPPPGAFPEGVQCYWGHTTDRSRMKTCTDGSNPVCPDCCHRDCPNEYPGMYTTCQKKGWPVWPPGAAGLSGAQPVKCYWKHTSDPSKLKTCTDGSNPVCPDCCHVNCPTQYPGMYQECARRNWPVWLPQSHGPAATSDIQCYWHHTTDRLRMKTCADGSSLVCPDCCHASCPKDTPDWQLRCQAQGFPVWPAGSTGGAAAGPRPLSGVGRTSPSGTQSTSAQFSIPRAQLSDWPWDIELLQDGSPVLPTGGSYLLQKRPFTIRLRMPKPATVRLNTLDSDKNFKSVQPGLRVENEQVFAPRPGGIPVRHCFSAGTGVVDADYHRTRLVVSESGHQEIFFTSYLDHRWSKVDVTEQRAVFERKVQHISLAAQGYDEPVERTRCGQLYLLFLVRHHKDPEIQDDELRKLVLTFR